MELLWIIFSRVISPLKNDDLIALNTSSLVDRLGIDPLSAEVGLCTGYKKCRRCINFVKSSKAEITTVYDIDCACLDDQLVEVIDIYYL